ncbi:reverse transcriptase domain-containing protein [Tanacetum coccineum]|uniref:Reverse transcriptase domain-containing protein n=1 Tax=Tanacetum coccineum TaxID=301880 RepID=A0ABQ4X7G1_9ASTR
MGKKLLKSLKLVHEGPTGGHHSANLTARKVFDAGFFCPTIYRDANSMIKSCDTCQRQGPVLPILVLWVSKSAGHLRAGDWDGQDESRYRDDLTLNSLLWVECEALYFAT